MFFTEAYPGEWNRGSAQAEQKLCRNETEALPERNRGSAGTKQRLCRNQTEAR
ncbi:hypothetical protein JCM6294_1280 [Bacteroides pyogenes DSM 20611 = JCM 6294]|uniref:Uncharacterized protein n=1 Tax=Bacteroides pyogenes DSM 20611 = JCM 6294 TaxID=1121100 RepID=W4PG62_9BACE|nr:hypothetical protein JCM6294_1280 [Bacteroides pyogenes DSM 20611 = JCM 6294]